MGLFDNLFKPKTDSAPGEHVETAPATDVPPPGGSAVGVPPPKPPVIAAPAAFSPRSLGQVITPGRAGSPAQRSAPAERRAGTGDAEGKAPREVVLTLDDVLARIPADLLTPGPHDGHRPLRFAIDNLSADIARGRAAVPLSQIAAQCADIFRVPITEDNDALVRLPLQKLVEQITPGGISAALSRKPAAEPADAKIHLSIAAILRTCPREIIVGELPPVSDSDRVVFPLAPIERQLPSGKVDVSSIRFVAALPLHMHEFFRALEGVRVPLPLDEIFQNLPTQPAAAPSIAPAPASVPAPAPPPAAFVHPTPADDPGRPAASAPVPTATPAVPPVAVSAPLPAVAVPAPAESVAASSASIQAPVALAPAPSEPIAEPSVPAPIAPLVASPVSAPVASVAPVAELPPASQPTPDSAPAPEPAPPVAQEAGEPPRAEPAAAPVTPAPLVLPKPSSPEAQADLAKDEIAQLRARIAALKVEFDVASIAPAEVTPAPAETPPSPVELPLAIFAPSAPAAPPISLAPPISFAPPVPVTPAPVTPAPEAVPAQPRKEAPAISMSGPGSGVVPVFAREGSIVAPTPPLASPPAPSAVPIPELFRPPLVPPPIEPVVVVAAPKIEPPAPVMLPVRIVAPLPARPHVAPPRLFSAGENVPLSAIHPPEPVAPPEPPAPPPPPPPPPLALDPVGAALGLAGTLTLTRVAEHLTALPGLAACVLDVRHESAEAGGFPEDSDAAATRILAAPFAEALASRAGEHITIFGEQGGISIFARGHARLAVLHRARVFLPGVREKLAAAVDALAEA